MTPFESVRLVAGREVTQRLRARSFYVFTALLCAVIIAAGVLSAVFDDAGTAHYDVALIGAVPPGFDSAVLNVASAFNVEIELHEQASTRDALDGVQRGEFTAAIDPETGVLTSKGAPADVVRSAIDAGWQSSEAVRAAADLGLSATQLASVLQPRPLAVVTLDTGEPANRGVGMAVGTVSAILLFLSINFFGSYVLMGVVEEKSTGVVEVLLSHVRAYQLLAGKVIGIGIAAMVQFAAAVLAGLIALKISGVSVPAQVWVGLPTTLVWFIGGFMLYSTLFALAGSFVSRQEDAQGASAPISIVFTAAYFAVFTLGNAPDALASRIVSILPPFAPMLMPIRIAVGSASIGEIALAAILLALAVFGMLRLAGSVYSRTLLHRGARLRWRQALRLRSRE